MTKDEAKEKMQELIKKVIILFHLENSKRNNHFNEEEKLKYL